MMNPRKFQVVWPAAEKARWPGVELDLLQRGTATKARFPFKRNGLRCVLCVCCVNENRKKRKRLHSQAANHGCHCFDRAFLLAGACVRCVKLNDVHGDIFAYCKISRSASVKNREIISLLVPLMRFSCSFTTFFSFYFATTALMHYG